MSYCLLFLKLFKVNNFIFIYRELSIAQAWDLCKKQRGDRGPTLPLDKIIWEGKGGCGDTLAPRIYDKFDATDGCADKLKPEIMLEIWNFFKTGNCIQLAEKTTCINPTLLTSVTNEYTIAVAACPFEGFVPLPFRELKSSKRKGVVLGYCQNVLKKQLVQLRYSSLKETTFFNFHVGGSMQLCLSEPDFKNHFQIVECSNLIEHIGLVNVLLAARRCLTEDAESIVLTDSIQWQIHKPTIPEYVESVLCCPLTLIPTLYGLRLANHVRLGRFSPVNMLRQEPEATTLKWQNVPTFSEDVKLNLELSSSLKTAFSLLKNECFLQNDDFDFAVDLREGTSLTPMTYYYVIQSLLSRASWNQEAAKFFLEPAIAKPFKLFWQTITECLDGQEVSYLFI